MNVKGRFFHRVGFPTSIRIVSFLLLPPSDPLRFRLELSQSAVINLPHESMLQTLILKKVFQFSGHPIQVITETYLSHLTIFMLTQKSVG